MIRTDDEALGWFSLFSVKGLGPKRLHRIHASMQERGRAVSDLAGQSATELAHWLPGLSESLRDAIAAIDWEARRTEFEQLSDQEIRFIHLGHPDYPELLSQRMGESAPALLFCRGNVGLLRAASVAIVGCRDASPQGIAIAEELAGKLARARINVISGYARGVDAAAHRGALAAEGSTTVVLSSGILEFAPKQDWEDVHWERDVLVVSQFHPRERWRAANAMIRNRLVCAMAQGVVVIESGEERSEDGTMSGTFEAAKEALEMAVPLFVLTPESLEAPPRGNRALIERGGIEFTPENALELIMQGIQRPPPAAVLDHPRQLSIFS